MVKIIPVVIPRYNVVQVQPSLSAKLEDLFCHAPVLEFGTRFGDALNCPSDAELRDFARKAPPLFGGAVLREGAIDQMPDGYFAKLYDNLVFNYIPDADVFPVRLDDCYATARQSIPSLAMASAMLVGIIDSIRETVDPSIKNVAEQLMRLVAHVNYTWLAALQNQGDYRLIFGGATVMHMGEYTARYVWIDSDLLQPYLEKGWTAESVASNYVKDLK